MRNLYPILKDNNIYDRLDAILVSIMINSFSVSSNDTPPQFSGVRSNYSIHLGSVVDVATAPLSVTAYIARKTGNVVHRAVSSCDTDVGNLINYIDSANFPKLSQYDSEDNLYLLKKKTKKKVDSIHTYTVIWDLDKLADVVVKAYADAEDAAKVEAAPKAKEAYNAVLKEYAAKVEAAKEAYDAVVKADAEDAVKAKEAYDAVVKAEAWNAAKAKVDAAKVAYKAVVIEYDKKKAYTNNVDEMVNKADTARKAAFQAAVELMANDAEAEVKLANDAEAEANLAKANLAKANSRTTENQEANQAKNAYAKNAEAYAEKAKAYAEKAKAAKNAYVYAAEKLNAWNAAKKAYVDAAKQELENADAEVALNAAEVAAEKAYADAEDAAEKAVKWQKEVKKFKRFNMFKGGKSRKSRRKRTRTRRRKNSRSHRRRR